MSKSRLRSPVITITVGRARTSINFSRKSTPQCNASVNASLVMRKILFTPDPPEGGNTPPAPTPAPAPAAPPAATSVVNGKTESEVNLECQLEEERTARKKAETDAAYLSDENRRLKEVPPPTEKKSDGWHWPGEEPD